MCVAGAEGKPVNQLLMAKKMNLINEMYFAILLDRESGGPLVIACSEGGTSIEVLAERSPEKIIKEPINIAVGMTDGAHSFLRRPSAEACTHKCQSPWRTCHACNSHN